jgi:ubiquinone/menaquinone biosynthesis C-methylase UbiE
MPNVETSMQSYYAMRAPEHDRVYEKPERQIDLQRLRQWLPAVFSGRRVLEIACGTGYWTQFIAPVASGILAVDAAAETLEIARSRPQNAGVTFVIGDAYRLPRDQGTFSAAFAGFWFSHITKGRRREFLSGLGDLLEPGATVLFLDNHYVPGSSTPISEEDGDGNTYQARRLADGSAHRVLKNFPSEAELRDLIVGLGENAVFTKLEYYWVFQYSACR